MFSPKAYLQDWIATNLSDWVENIEEDSIEIGLLDGDFKLSNLILKERTFAINNELSLSLEIGSIEKLVIQIPWTQLHTGLINTLVENIQIVLQLNILNNNSKENTENVNENFAQDRKLDMLEKEEIRLLGDTTDARSWFDRNSDSILRSFLTKMMANCTLTARNIQLSVLIPRSDEEFAVVNVSLQSFEMNQGDRNKSSNQHTASTCHVPGTFEVFLKKDLDIRDLTMSLDTINKVDAEENLLAALENCRNDRLSDGLTGGFAIGFPPVLHFGSKEMVAR
jgi:hypothetical protein